MTAYDTMRMRREADHALQQECARRDAAAIPRSLSQVADRLAGQQHGGEQVAEIRKFVAATQDPQQMAKAEQYRALDARVQRGTAKRDRDRGFER